MPFSNESPIRPSVMSFARLLASLYPREEVERVASSALKFAPFLRDPVGYSREILHVNWTPAQQRIAELTQQPPYRVLVLSAHNVGKTHLGAGLTNWWYDTRDPGVVVTTAPTDRDVKDLLWTEVRLQRRGAGMGGFRGRRASEIFGSEDHLAKGFTAARGESFQGRHRERMLFLMDEAIGIDPVFWEVTETMFQNTGEHAWVCFLNPTDTASQAYQEWLTAGDGYPQRGWHVVSMGAREHPNIAAELAGELPPYPGAVRLAQLDTWVRKWCTPIPPGDATATEFEWPPRSGCWWRPGPLFECRAGGAWPSQSTYSVWSHLLFEACARSVVTDERLPRHTVPEIGCDVARFGDDFTSMVCQDWGVALHHETHNGWSTTQTAAQLKRLCVQMVEHCKRKNPDFSIQAEQIPVKIDADGLGGGVVDQADGFNFIGISGSATLDSEDWRTVRSKLWFHAADLAKGAELHLGRLSKEAISLLRQQCVAPRYKVIGRGQLEVEKKDETKARLGRSPDDMDALNLSLYRPPRFEAPPTVKEQERGRLDARGRERGGPGESRRRRY